jgi:hypothetical protein
MFAIYRGNFLQPANTSVMAYISYQSDWGRRFRLSSSGFTKAELLLYADIIPLSIQQQFTPIISSGCSIPFLKLRRLIIDAVDPVLSIVYPFNSESPQHEQSLHELKTNPRVVKWTVIGEEWSEC